jgi:AcrR family transcriptional regulator
MDGRTQSAEGGAVVDSQRGAHLLDAALEVVADKGLAGLSVRTVAARAGTSPAQVQYYFPTKHALVAAAYQHASDQFLVTIQTELSAPRTVQRLRRILWAWLPLSPDTERRARVWVAFAAAAVTDPALAAAAEAFDADLHGWLADDLAELQHAGWLTLRLNPSDAAAQLLALLDGITLHTLLRQLPERADLADRTLGEWLRHLENPAATADAATTEHR